jgi:MFS family permease
VLANIVFLIVSGSLSDEAFFDWGWRIPFLISIVLIGLSLFVQLTLEDTVAFRELKEAQLKDAKKLARDMPGEATKEKRKVSPVLEVLRLHPREIVLAAGAFLAVQVTFYIMVAFVVAYGSNPAGLGLPREFMLMAVLIASLVQIPVLFLASAYSDRHGRRGIYMLGAILGAVWGFALFPLIDTGEFVWIVLAVTGGQVFVGLMYGPQAAFLSELFSTHVRYSGASLGYQLGAILGGALAPIIATALWSTLGTFYVSIYIAIASGLTMVSVLLLTETSGRDLDQIGQENQ